MLKPTTSYESPEQHSAELYQSLGDGLTNAREQLAPVVGGALALTEPNWPVTAFAALTQLTDMADGRLVRKAAALRGYGIQTDGAEQDPRADRKLTNAEIGGLAIRALRAGDTRAGAVLGANLLVSQWRNTRMEQNRQAIKDNGLDPHELRAIKINKTKMWLQSLALTTLASPLSRHKKVRTGALITLSAGTATGVIGERIFRNRVQRLIAGPQQEM